MCKDKFHELNESINDYASINDACGYSEAQVHSQCNKAIVEGNCSMEGLCVDLELTDGALLGCSNNNNSTSTKSELHPLLPMA